MKREWTVGTRGSQLALFQTRRVVATLQEHHPDLVFTIHEIKTSGDKDQSSFLSTLRNTQFFTKELDDAMLAGEIDLAVHSLKDVILELPEGIALAATTEREEHRDALVSWHGAKLMELPLNAVIGTGSVRRRAFLHRARPDVTFVEIRGNLDTRLRKLSEGQYDAIVLAACGLIRMGWAGRITELLDSNIILSAAGQGSIAVTARSGEPDAGILLRPVHHLETYYRVQAERIFLGALTASCRFPLGVFAVISDGILTLEAAAYSLDGTRGIHRTGAGPEEDFEAIARALAREFKQDGIDELAAC
jgi:hydroxymethylbilane synthase